MRNICSHCTLRMVELSSIETKGNTFQLQILSCILSRLTPAATGHQLCLRSTLRVTRRHGEAVTGFTWVYCISFALHQRFTKHQKLRQVTWYFFHTSTVATCLSCVDAASSYILHNTTYVIRVIRKSCHLNQGGWPVFPQVFSVKFCGVYLMLGRNTLNFKPIC